uniref:Ig-like domain-containing protein n=1 Tax=Xenorhabdus stockiae TaxID=351614 RepID=UPI001475B8D4
QTKKTNDSGELIATLDSSKPFNKVTVSLAIENHPAISTKVPVSIESEHAYHIQEEFLTVSPQGPLLVGDGKFYTFSGTVVDRHNNPVKTQEIKTVVWKATDDKGQEVKLTSQTKKTNDSGELIATLDSSKPFNKITVSLAIENHPAISTKVPVSIESEHAYHIQEEFLTVSPQGPLLVGDGKFYTFSGTVVDRHNNPVKTQEIKTVVWKATDDKGQEVKLTSQTKKTNDSGELIATLDSSKPFNKITVSLAIENHPAISTKVPVSIQSEHITVECKAFGKTPVLVGESYICTAHVTDLDGGIAGEKIVWKVNDPDLQLEPTSEVTDNDGKMTATLTSSKKVLGLVVTASVIEPSGTQSSGESTEDIISFIWPEITINPTSKNPVVVANGQDSYEFTATIWRDKQNNEPYKEPVMKFAWGRPQLQDDTGTTEPNLTPPPDEPLEVNPKDGTLTATMTSLQWGQVKACINIVDRDPASPICSKLVNFALDFEIAKDSVEIYKVNRAGNEEAFDPNKPLLGDGKSEYMYRAQIIDKKSKKPVSDYLFSEVNWTRNLPDVTGKQLNLEWDKEGKTNSDGYLYATLKSNVGLNKKRVEVTFNMAGISPESTFFQVAKQAVTFDVSPELAAIRVYKYDPNTGKVDKSVSKSFTEQERPYNVFYPLAAEFTSAKGKVLVESGDNIKYTPELGWWSPMYIDSNGLVIFTDNPGSQEVILHITKKNGTQQQYTYKFFTRRFFGIRSDMIGNYKLNDGNDCEKPPNNVAIFLSPLDSELVSTGTGTSLHDEFPDAYKFGILDGITIKNKNNIYIKMLKTRQNSGVASYFPYNLLTGQEFIGDPYDDVYVLCEKYYQKHGRNVFK